MSEVENFYEWLDKQTYNERIAFVKAMKEKGISRQSIGNWTSRRNSVADKYHPIIKEYAGKELAFPRVKLIPTLVMEGEST